MAFDFPTSPVIGDLYPTPAVPGVPQYRWDGTVWAAQPISDAPLYVKKAGDTMTGHLSLPITPVAANAVRKDYVDAAIAAAPAGFPAGTVMVFYQAAAPTGWTKITTQNDKALRVVSGSGGVAGGTYAFSTVMAQTVVGSWTLSTVEIPAHSHGNYLGLAHSSPSYWNSFAYGSTGNMYYSYQGDNAGSGGTHGHSITMNMQYIDVILGDN